MTEDDPETTSDVKGNAPDGDGDAVDAVPPDDETE